jgi:hypothetical protein
MRSSAQSLDNLLGLAGNLATSKTDDREGNEEIEGAERIKVLFICQLLPVERKPCDATSGGCKGRGTGEDKKEL